MPLVSSQTSTKGQGLPRPDRMTAMGLGAELAGGFMTNEKNAAISLKHDGRRRAPRGDEGVYATHGIVLPMAFTFLDPPLEDPIISAFCGLIL